MAASNPVVKIAFTWDQWCAYQEKRLGSEKRQQEGIPFSDCELARLAFVRWRYQTGRFDLDLDN